MFVRLVVSSPSRNIVRLGQQERRWHDAGNLSWKATLLTFVAGSVLQTALPLEAKAKSATSPVAETGKVSAYTSGKAARKNKEASVRSDAYEKIVVKARSSQELSRQQALTYQNRPVSASVVTRDYLENNQINDLVTATRSVAGVGFTYGNLIDQTINIRGIGNSNANYTFGIPSGTGIYVDGSFQPYPGSWSADIPDLIGVDVLKGPQGTLGGFDSTGGVVKVNTALPSFTPSIKTEVSGGSYGDIRGKASITGPLFGSNWAAYRIGFFSEDNDGYVTSTTNANARFDDVHNKSVRLQLLLKPSDNLTIRIIGSYANIYTHVGRPANGVIENYTNGASYPASGLNFYQRYALVGKNPYLYGLKSYAIESGSHYPQEGNFNATASAEVTWKLNSGFVLSSLSAFNAYEFNYNGYHDTTLNIDTTRNGGLQPFSAKSVQEDINISIPKNKIVEAKAGIFYYYTGDIIRANGETGSQNGLYYGSTALPDYVNALALNHVHTRSYENLQSHSLSPYIHAVWHATNRFNITTGLRYTYTSRTGQASGEVTGQSLEGLTPAQQTAARAERVANSGNSSSSWSYYVPTHDHSVSGTISLSYQISPNALAYATYSRGIRAGGPNITNPLSLPTGAALAIKPEKLDNFEVGLKNQFLDGHLVTSFDAFWENDHDYITQVSLLNPAGTSVISYMANAKRAVSRGFEGDIRAYPINGLSVHLSGAYDDAYYASFASAPCAPEVQNVARSCNFKGRPLQITPKFSFTVGGDFQHSLGTKIPYINQDLIGFIGVDYTWQSKIYTSPTDSIYSIVPKYGLLNVRVGLESANHKYKLTGWIHNATNHHYYTNVAAGAAGLISGYVGAPLMAGGSLSVTW